MSARDQLGGKAVSLWVDTAERTEFPKLEGPVRVDVAIVGGGVAGLTAAALLKQAGSRVAVLEAGRVGTGVTGHTTGKVSSLHQLVYQELRRSFGVGGARVYGEANQAAIEQVARLVESEEIDCDFRRVDNYTYAESTSALEKVEEEAAIAQQLGLPGEFTRSVPLPYPVAGAVRFSDQAQLHATNYLGGLARSVSSEGSHVFERTRAAKVEDGSPCRIETEVGSVIADAVIIATNFPMLDRGLFFARCHPHRSYLVALRLDGESPEGTFISVDEPMRSILPYRHGEESFLLVGGEGHRASDSVDAGQRYLNLENWARERFPVFSLEYRWSTQDAIPVDGMPFVGKMSPFSKNLYVATGFRKWGLTNGTVAAMILSDQILDQPNPWARTFNSNRFRPIAAAPRFVSENLRVGARLVGGWIKSRSSAVDELEPGEAKVLDLKGEKVAAYKDGGGDVHAVSAACTHMGCMVEWNGVDKTWDCPCHGSRFEPDGAVIQGPAVDDLPPASSD